MNSDPTPNSSSHSDSQPEPALHGTTTGRHPASQPKPPSKTSSAAIIGAVALVSLFCLLICLNWHKLTHRIGQDEAAGEGTIKVVPVVLRKLFTEDRLPAEIEAYQDILIYPKVPGFIKWIGVDRGSVVKKDQLLVTMYAPEYLARRNEALAKVAGAKAAIAAAESRLQDTQADLKKAQANLIADQSTYQRVNAASMVPGVIAENDVVQWAQTVEVDQQAVNTFTKRVNVRYHELQLRNEELTAETKAFQDLATMSSYLEIKAPFNGYVTERTMHVGSFVGPDGTGAYPPIVRIKQLDLLRIVTPVPEDETAGVVAGSQVQFSVESFPDRRFNGTIARISNDLAKETRTMPVELNFFNPDYKILPGMFCEVYWPIRRRQNSMFVPQSAVVTTPLESFVCKITDGVVNWVSVTKGEIMGDTVEIFGDLKEGDLVAEHASEEIQNRSHVKVVASGDTQLH